MALITDKPEELKPTNDLDDVYDPDLDEDGTSIDRYLAFGTTPKAVPNPPRDGEIIEYTVKVECVGQAHKRRADGEVRYRSELTILSVARSGQELPPDYAPEPTAAQKRAAEKAAAEAARAEAQQETDENQPPMFDEDGDPLAASDDVVDAEVVEDDEDQADEPVVDRPAFSDVTP